MTRKSPWYGWTILVVSSLALVATSPGQTYIVSLFNLALRRDLGLSATELSGAYMAATLGSAALMSSVGKVSDRLGPGRLMIAAAVGLGLATVWLGRVESLWMLGLGFFGVRLCGQGALSLGSGHALAMWFERRLGFAEGIRLTVFGLGMAGLPLLATASIARFGWRATFPALGLGSAVLVTGAVLLLQRDRPEDMGQSLDGDPPREDVAGGEPPWGLTLREAMRTQGLWAVVLASMNSGMIVTALTFQLQPLAVAAGMKEAAAAGLIGTFAVVSTSLFFVAGSLSDRLRPGWVFAAAATLVAVSTGLHEVGGPVGIRVAWGLLGAASALQMTTSSPTLARCFGRAHHGSIRGFVTTVSVAGTAVGPLVLGLSEDLTGGFAVGLRGFVLWSLGVAAFALWARIERPSLR